MDKIVIIGASGHAKVVIDIIEKQGVFKIIGLVDSFKSIGEKIFNYTVIGNEENIPKIIEDFQVIGGIIAIGDNYTRMSLYNSICSISKSFKFITAIHPNAILGKNISIGDGSVVMAGVVINSDTTIGIQNIINTKCSIDHDVTCKDFSSIAPGATIGGGVYIGTGTSICLGANIIEGISIGNYSVVGAGALVLKDVGDNEVTYGVPSKKIRFRKNSDKYLGHFDSKSKTESFSFEFATIKTQKDIIIYNAILEKLKMFNTFYSIPYCKTESSNNLSYFLLKKKNEPVILMPIILTLIESNLFENNQTYMDATSPYGFNGPLFNNNINDFSLMLFWKNVDNWYKKNNVVTEFIRFNLDFNYKNYTGNLISTLNNVVGQLGSFEIIWNNFKQKVRNNYRKAESNNLKIKFFKNELITADILSDFYNIYIDTMERNKATGNYFYSKEYFEDLINYKQNNILITMVYFEDKAISTELIIINHKTMYSYLGGTLNNYFEFRPNDFLKIEVIKWGLENNMNFYALGGGRKNNDGLYQYKKAFFPKDNNVVFYTGRKVINENVYNILIKDLSLDQEQIENLVIDSSLYFPYYNKPK